MKRILFLVVALVAAMIGLGFIMPALAQWRAVGSMTPSSVALFLLGLLLTVAGLTMGIRPWLRRP